MKRLVPSLFAGFVCGLVFAACQYTPDFEGVRCDAASPCPDDYACGAADGLCHLRTDGGAGGGGGSGGGLGGGAGGGPSDCTDCTQAGCAGRVCRPAANICDAPEVCAGGVCPADAKADAGKLCVAPTCLTASRTSFACDGLGGCRRSPDVACAPYLCDPLANDCYASCVSPADCSSATDYCDAGACVPRAPPGAPCGGNGQCETGFCVDGVCCNSACGAACDVCNLAASRGVCTPVPRSDAGVTTCGDYLCDGVKGTCPTQCSANSDCVATAFCNGTGTCEARRALGGACGTDNSLCLSGFCTDGVCCESACAGGCNQCSSQGLCITVDAGHPGANPQCAPYLCNGTSGACPTTCGSLLDCAPGSTSCNGTCIGQLGNGNACDAGALCLSGQCVDGVCCNSACGSACDICNLAGKAGTCTPNAGQPGTPSCGTYLCAADAGTCPSTCTADAQCAAGNYCKDGGICTAKKALGNTCAIGGECSSNFCADQVCCDSACTGTCRSCLAANTGGVQGTCANVSPGNDPDSNCNLYYCAAGGVCATSCPGAACPVVAGTCKPGSACGGVATSPACLPVSDAGVRCANDCQCASATCRLFFEDSDGDGQGANVGTRFCTVAPAGYVSNNTDCCDSDRDAGVQVDAPFHSGPDNCGSFDWDCSGAVEPADGGVGGMECTAQSQTCNTSCTGSGIEGWSGTNAPACGTTGTYYSGCKTDIIYGVAGCSPSPKYECTQYVDYSKTQTCR